MGGEAIGSCVINSVSQSGSTGLYLLFSAGKRPSRAALRDFAKAQRAVSLSHDPAEGAQLHLVDTSPDGLANLEEWPQPKVDESVWVELLREGLTFDLVGLGPGSACEFPEIEHRFDLDAIPTAFRYEAVHLAPGHHLTGGESSVPVARGLIGLARDLTHHFEDIQAVVWCASGSAMGRRFFESVTTAWLEGGAFPALGLTAFRSCNDGALQSVGLDFWIGQELRLEPMLCADKVAATRLGVRLVNQLVITGALIAPERIAAPDGIRLVMQPSQNGKYIRVSRE